MELIFTAGLGRSGMPEAFVMIDHHDQKDNMTNRKQNSMCILQPANMSTMFLSPFFFKWRVTFSMKWWKRWEKKKKPSCPFPLLGTSSSKWVRAAVAFSLYRSYLRPTIFGWLHNIRVARRRTEKAWWSRVGIFHIHALYWLPVTWSMVHPQTRWNPYLACFLYFQLYFSSPGREILYLICFLPIASPR